MCRYARGSTTGRPKYIFKLHGSNVNTQLTGDERDTLSAMRRVTYFTGHVCLIFGQENMSSYLGTLVHYLMKIIQISSTLIII